MLFFRLQQEHCAARNPANVTVNQAHRDTAVRKATRDPRVLVDPVAHVDRVVHQAILAKRVSKEIKERKEPRETRATPARQVHQAAMVKRV